MHVHVQNEWFLIKFKEIRLKTGWKREGGLPCAHGPVRRVTTKHHKLHKQVMCCFYPNTLFYTLNTFFFCWDPWAKEVSLQTILCEMLLTCIYCDWLSTLIIGISVPTGGFQFLCSQAFSKCWQRPRKHYLLRGLLLELLVHVTHTKRERERESIFSYSNIDKLTVERQEMERQCFPPVLQHCTWIGRWYTYSSGALPKSQWRNQTLLLFQVQKNNLHSTPRYFFYCSVCIKPPTETANWSTKRECGEDEQRSEESRWSSLWTWRTGVVGTVSSSISSKPGRWKSAIYLIFGIFVLF